MVEIVVGGNRFVARVRSVEAFREGLLEVLLGSVSVSFAAPTEQLPPMPSEIVSRLYLDTYGVELPTPEEVARLRADSAELARLLVGEMS
jgi:hypothetical protein